MTITEADRRVLLAYSSIKDVGPQWRRKVVRVWLVMIILVGCLAATLFLAELPLLAGFVVGILVGAMLRDYRYVVSAKASWPVVREITDWKRVQELLDMS
jgi:hypothetical protein